MYKSKFKENEDYMGGHKAPVNDGYNAPLYDVTLNGIYPEDIYSVNGLRYYGDGSTASDSECIYIIQATRNKPNKRIKIYRAVPDFNYDNNKKIKELRSAMNHKVKYRFFPSSMKNGFDYFQTITKECLKIYDKNKKMTYDEYQQLIIDTCDERIKQLSSKEPKLKINVGDWVSISKRYAVEHGHHSLNSKFKIITKEVKASQLWTDGNSINEWGYDV